MHPVEQAISLRRELHQRPELSGAEAATSARLEAFFKPMRHDRILTGLGGDDGKPGHSLVVCWGNASDGPTIMLRAELDALPIHEEGDHPQRSLVEGVAHLCGHDGHMAILAAVGATLAQRRPGRGRVALLFQSAEETGAGAAALLRDERFLALKPDAILALHNLPGFPLGRIVARSGAMCCASRGMTVRFTGRTAHAAQPETGASPAPAIAELIEFFGKLQGENRNEIAFATVVGAAMGEGSFGATPAAGEVMATLRCERDASMARLTELSEQEATRIANHHRLSACFNYQDDFPATSNAPQLVDRIARLAPGSAMTTPDAPFRWSEDFGRYAAIAPTALFGLGAGEDAPALHDPAYRFPDELIETGSAIFLRLIDDLLEEPV